MRRRMAAIGLAIATMISGCFGGAAWPSVLGPEKALAAEGAEPLNTAWGKAIAAAAGKNSGLEVYRTTIQQRSTDVTAAIARSRTALLETAGPRPADATLENDLAKLMRLPSANQQLLAAREDFSLAARNAEKQATVLLSSYAVTVKKTEIWNETVKHLAQARERVTTRARFGLAAQEDLKAMDEKYAKARVEASNAKKAQDDALRKLEESFGGAGLSKFRTNDLFLDVRVDTAGVDTLVSAALDSDPTLRKLHSARRLEEQKYAFALQLYRSFFGADAIGPVEATLNLRPVDYKLSLAVYNVFLAELKRQDTARPLFERLLFPPKENYLGEQPYTLPAAILSLSSASALEREQVKALTDQVNAYYLAALMEETAMRQAVRAEADAKAVVQTATAMQKAGLAAEAAVMAAQEAYGRAQIDAVQASRAYFSAVMELHFATGGAFAKRLDGDVRAPIGKPASQEGQPGVAAASDEPLVAYDPLMEADLAKAAEKLQGQVEAAAEKSAAEADAEEGADSVAAEGSGSEGNPSTGDGTPTGGSIAEGGTTGGGTASGGASGEDGLEGDPAEEEAVDPAPLLMIEYDQLTEALKLAQAAGAGNVAAVMSDKLAASKAALLKALGLPASAPSGGTNGTEENRNAKEAELVAFLPFLELGLFPALEEELLADWSEDAKSAYEESELQQLAAMGGWTAPDGEQAVPLPAESIAFAALPVKLTMPPVMIGSNVYVPVRPYAEALGYRVVWNAMSSTARLQQPGGDIEIQVGTRTVELPSGATKLASVTVMVKGQTFVPLSFFSDILGLQVFWSEGLLQGVLIRPAGQGTRTE